MTSPASAHRPCGFDSWPRRGLPGRQDVGAEQPRLPPATSSPCALRLICQEGAAGMALSSPTVSEEVGSLPQHGCEWTGWQQGCLQARRGQTCTAVATICSSLLAQACWRPREGLREAVWRGLEGGQGCMPETWAPSCPSPSFRSPGRPLQASSQSEFETKACTIFPSSCLNKDSTGPAEPGDLRQELR